MVSDVDVAERRSAVEASQGERAIQLEVVICAAVAIAGALLIALIALPLAVYPALIKFSPNGLATLAVPWRLSKGLEFAYYATAFAALLPIGLLVGHTYVRHLERRGRDAFGVVWTHAAAVVAVVVVAKSILAYAPPFPDPARQYWVRPLAGSVIVALCLLAASGVLALRTPSLRYLRIRPSYRTSALVALILTVSLALMPQWTFAVSHGLVAAVVAAAVCVAAVMLRRIRRPMVRFPWAIEVMCLLVVALLTWDLRLGRATQLIRLAHYQNVYLGPANAVLHGGTMLVDVFAQYGPGTTYFLAAYFAIVPIGYGTFWLLAVALDVALFTIFYAIVRLAGGSRILALSGTTFAVLAGVIAKPGGQETIVPNRPLRLLLPFLAILFVQLREKWPRRGALWSWLIATIVAISSVWAIEVFFYVLVAAAAAELCRARLNAAGDAIRPDWRSASRIAAAVAAAQAAFTLATRLASGDWPDWLQYIQYARRYTSGEGTQPFQPFQPGMLLGVFYFTATALVIGIAIWRREFAQTRRQTLIALAAACGLGVAYYSYFAGQSQVVNVYKMAPVAVLVAVLLIATAPSRPSEAVAYPRNVLVFLFVWCFTLATIAEPRVVQHQFEHTALTSTPNATLDDVRYAARVPEIDPTADATAAYLRETISGEHNLVLLGAYELTTEVLLRARRGQLLPMADPYGESLLRERMDYLERRARQLAVGTRFLTTHREFAASFTTGGLANDLDARLIRALRESYVLRLADRGPEDLVVYQLVRRRS